MVDFLYRSFWELIVIGAIFGIVYGVGTSVDLTDLITITTKAERYIK